MLKKIVTGILIFLSMFLFGFVAVNGGIPAPFLAIYWAVVFLYWSVNLWSQHRR